MDEILNNRSKLLDQTLSYLFKPKVKNPSSKLIKSVLIHKSIASRPSRLSNPSSIKISSESIKDVFDSYESTPMISENQSICQLSLAVIKTPFIAECGHVFEESAAREYLNQSRFSGSIKCPIIGCSKLLKRSKN